MSGSTGPDWAGVFVRGRAHPGGPLDLQERLVEIVARAGRAWPDLGLDPSHLVAQLARAVGDDIAAGLAELYVEDFALAVACMDRLPGALELVDKLCGPAVVAAVARVDRSPELRDEVRQILWQRLFVGTGAAAPRILSYAGRGPLAGWVAVAAQRVALDLRRDAARAVASDPDADQLLPANDHPEADYLRARYRVEFETAVHTALRALPDRDRLLLRLTTVCGLSHAQIANIYKVNQSTVTRWIARARDEVLEATEQAMCGKLGVPRAEFRSLAGLLLSRIDLSVSRVLAASPESTP
jgi:RNA polymerase sigma-70 factor (ECF subfamily)